MDIDYILDKYVGGGNRWQWLTLLILCPTAWAAYYPVFLHIFAAFEPTHRCFVPSCDDAIKSVTNVTFSMASLRISDTFKSVTNAYDITTHPCFDLSCNETISNATLFMTSMRISDALKSVMNATHTDFTIPKEHIYNNIFAENAKMNPCRYYSTMF
jgi:hypothetical protein